MKKILISMLFLFLYTCTVSSAEEFSGKRQITSFLEGVANELVSGDIKSVFEKIKKYWPIPEEELYSVVYQLESRRSHISSRFGKPLGMEFADRGSFGKSFYREIYLIKYEKHAISWIFTFYKPKDGWIVNSIVASDQVDELFAVSSSGI